jgi:hypothetical protein
MISSQFIVRQAGLAAVRRFVEPDGWSLISETENLALMKNVEYQWPLKIRSGCGSHFSLRKSDLTRPSLILGYVWNIDTTPEVYLLKPEEALDFLGTKPLHTKAWMNGHYYKWSSSTGLPKSKYFEFRSKFQRGNKNIADFLTP